MTGMFSNFNSISYTDDLYELRVIGMKCRLPDTMSGTGEIFISGADIDLIFDKLVSLIRRLTKLGQFLDINEMPSPSNSGLACVL